MSLSGPVGTTLNWADLVDDGPLPPLPFFDKKPTVTTNSESVPVQPAERSQSAMAVEEQDSNPPPASRVPNTMGTTRAQPPASESSSLFAGAHSSVNGPPPAPAAPLSSGPFSPNSVFCRAHDLIRGPASPQTASGPWKPTSPPWNSSLSGVTSRDTPWSPRHSFLSSTGPFSPRSNMPSASGVARVTIRPVPAPAAPVPAALTPADNAPISMMTTPQTPTLASPPGIPLAPPLPPSSPTSPAMTAAPAGPLASAMTPLALDTPAKASVGSVPF